MPAIKYIEKAFREETLETISQANLIIREYQQQGFSLTLRQLYYQFVARDLIPNSQKEYKRLGSVINDARLAGLIDWTAIEDRTRNLRRLPHWDGPQELLEAAIRQFRLDKWNNQPCYVEVWIEKDALIGVIEGVCNDLDLPYFSCRGYTSQSELWRAARRIIRETHYDERAIIIHLGDHDPSGIDMTRDIESRLLMFGAKSEVRRLALNWDQVEEFSPPPNPAKLTDSRAKGYISEYGRESWELDALNPNVIANLIRDAVTPIIDTTTWEADKDKEESYREQMIDIAQTTDWD